MARKNEAEALSLDSTDHHPASFIWRCSEESCMLGQSHMEITHVHLMPQGLHKAEWVPLHPSCPFSKSSQSTVISKVLLPTGKQSAGLFSDNPSHHVIPQRTCSLFSPESCLPPPAPASFFNGAYISLHGLPQLNIQTKQFKPWPFVFPQFRRLDVQDQGIGRFSSSAASLLGLQKATSPCVLTWSFFWVHTSLVFLCVYMFPFYRDTSQIG